MCISVSPGHSMPKITEKSKLNKYTKLAQIFNNLSRCVVYSKLRVYDSELGFNKSFLFVGLYLPWEIVIEMDESIRRHERQNQLKQNIYFRIKQEYENNWNQKYTKSKVRTFMLICWPPYRSHFQRVYNSYFWIRVTNVCGISGCSTNILYVGFTGL